MSKKVEEGEDVVDNDDADNDKLNKVKQKKAFSLFFDGDLVCLFV